MKRRDFVKTGLTAGAAAVTAGVPVGGVATARAAQRRPTRVLTGNLKHSVCKWCYRNLSVEELAGAAREIGLQSVELLGPEDWPALKKHGLVCAMASAPAPPEGMNAIARGFNRTEHHAWLVPAYERLIAAAAEAGYPNVICFSGNRAGLSDDEGLENCIQGIQQILPAAEKRGITVCMELLNSKVNHPDYMADHTAWGVALCQRVGSERFKLLYDIYHMQIMEGDVIRTIRDNHACIAHYHTGGVPGRHEIDETQELYYPAIMRAIVETGFQGYVAQEFIPARDPLTSLREAVALCTVPE